MEKFENKLEETIKSKINSFINEKEKYEKLIKPNEDEPYVPINLLEELYEDINNEYPMSNYFYYCDYLNEDYLLEQMKIYEYKKYPVLITYLKNKNNYKFKFLRNLSIFNEVLNLFREKYSFYITRKDAEKTLLKDNELYQNNKEKIEEFIKVYNDFNIEIKGKYNLSISNKLSEFFIEDNENNPIGKSYIKIYKEFIKTQNEQLKPLLDNKIENDKNDNSFINCIEKVNIQNIKEDEIFTLNLSEQSLMEIIFNNSYRKFAINNDRKSANQYNINYEQIEENMADMLLKEKKNVYRRN